MPQIGRVYRRVPDFTNAWNAMDIHDIALTLYTALLSRHDLVTASDETRVALGREAYHCAEAFFVAKDAYIRELPVTEIEADY